MGRGVVDPVHVLSRINALVLVVLEGTVHGLISRELFQLFFECCQYLRHRCAEILQLADVTAAAGYVADRKGSDTGLIARVSSPTLNHRPTATELTSIRLT